MKTISNEKKTRKIQKFAYVQKVNSKAWWGSHRKKETENGSIIQRLWVAFYDPHGSPREFVPNPSPKEKNFIYLFTLRSYTSIFIPNLILQSVYSMVAIVGCFVRNFTSNNHNNSFKWVGNKRASQGPPAGVGIPLPRGPVKRLPLLKYSRWGSRPRQWSCFCSSFSAQFDPISKDLAEALYSPSRTSDDTRTLGVNLYRLILLSSHAHHYYIPYTPFP